MADWIGVDVTEGIRTCAGCDSQIRPGARERNARKWCTETCRVRAHRNAHPKPEPIPTERSCAECGARFMGKGKTALCSVECKRLRANRLRRESGATTRYMKVRIARRRANGNYKKRVNRHSIADRDGWVCQICTEGIDPSAAWPDPSSLSIDHITPVSLGGDDSDENLRASHLSCNVRRGAQAA